MASLKNGNGQARLNSQLVAAQVGQELTGAITLPNGMELGPHELSQMGVLVQLAKLLAGNTDTGRLQEESLVITFTEED